MKLKGKSYEKLNKRSKRNTSDADDDESKLSERERMRNRERLGQRYI